MMNDRKNTKPIYIRFNKEELEQLRYLSIKEYRTLGGEVEYILKEHEVTGYRVPTKVNRQYKFNIYIDKKLYGKVKENAYLCGLTASDWIRSNLKSYYDEFMKNNKLK